MGSKVIDGICMSGLLTSVVLIMIVPRGNSSSIIPFNCFFQMLISGYLIINMHDDVWDSRTSLSLHFVYIDWIFLLWILFSMEEQVISRAHRMGATRPIHVETLAMSGTIEEQMLKFLQVERSFHVSLNFVLK